MRTFAQKQNQVQRLSSTNLTSSKSQTPAPSHEAHPLFQLQRSIGNQAVSRFLQTGADDLEVGANAKADPITEVGSKTPITIQPKLAINTPGDVYEQEADQVADQMMRMPEPQLQRACACAGGCDKCQTEQPNQEHQHLQTKHVGPGDAGPIAAPPIVHDVLASPGHPLDLSARAFFEPRFGHDFSKVRVHSGPAAAESARDLNANAYTVGNNMVFAAGQFATGTEAGRRLIAHELTHVVQQSGADASSVSRNNENSGETTVSQPVVERHSVARSVQRQPTASPEIEMPPEYVGAVNKPVDVLEAIVHIMAGNQVAGDYGPAGEQLMHPRYYTDIQKSITNEEYIALLWAWFYITNGVVTDKDGGQFIVEGSSARVKIQRAVADTQHLIAKVGAKEGAKWIARYRAKVQEFTQRAVREEVTGMIESGVTRELEARPNITVLSNDEQIKSLAIEAASQLPLLISQARRALGGQTTDRVNQRLQDLDLRTYLRDTFKRGLFVDPPEPQLRVMESKVSVPDALNWMKGGLDAVSAILSLSDPGARKKLFEARAGYLGKLTQGVEINQVLWRFVSGAVAVSGAATYGVAQALGNKYVAGRILQGSTKWLGNINSMFNVLGTIHGALVLLDPNSTSDERAAGAVEFTSNALGVASLASRGTSALASRLAWAGRWGGPVGISLTLNFALLSKGAEMARGAAIGLTRSDWAMCRRETVATAQEVQNWMRKLAVTNVLIAQETDPARLSELRFAANVYREELMDKHVKPYLADRLRASKPENDPHDCGPALTNRFKPIAWVLNGKIENDDAALNAGAMFLNLSFTALLEWDDIVASSIK